MYVSDQTDLHEDIYKALGLAPEDVVSLRVGIGRSDALTITSKKKATGPRKALKEAMSRHNVGDVEVRYTSEAFLSGPPSEPH